MTRKGKWFTGGVVGLAALVFAGLVLWFAPVVPWLRDDVEEWMAQELRTVAANELVPQLLFDELHYGFPYSVELSHARLVAADGTVLVEAKTIGLTLAELPTSGEPLQIEEVEARGATVRLLADGKGGLVGFSPFLRGEPSSDAELTASDVFRLHAVHLRDVDLHTQPDPERPPMILDGLSADLSLDPAEHRDGEVWYGFELTSERGDDLSLVATGALNLDRWQLVSDETEFDVHVDQDTIDSLPPGIRALTDEHDARGTFRARVSGLWDLRSSSHSSLLATLELHGFGLAFDELSVDADSVSARVALLPGMATLGELKATVLGGKVSGHGFVAMGEETAPAWAAGSIDGLSLARVLRKPDRSLSGHVRGKGHVRADLYDPAGTVRGAGTVHLSDGRLLRVPIVSRLADASGRDMKGSQSGSANLLLRGTRVEVTDLVLDTPVVGVRGEGHLTTSGRLELRVAAGPLQKADRGPVARGLGKVGEQLLSYRVDGTVSDPRVRPRPLSIGNRG